MISRTTTIKDILDIDPKVSNLLQRYDFQEFDISLKQLEENESVEPDFFLELVDLFVKGKEFDVSKLEVFSLTTILDYLKKTHRYYLDKKLPEMENVTAELAKCVDSNNSEIIHFFFLKFSTELKKHIQFEEQHVFPYILQLIDGVKPEMGRNSFRLAKFLQYHNDDIEKQLGEFRKHLKTTFSNLKDELAFRHFCQHTENFEKDLIIHGAIEDDLMMPKALCLEIELLA